MATFRIRLEAPVTLTATLDMDLDAEHAAAAETGALAEYTRRVAAFHQALAEYLRTDGRSPEPTIDIAWSVDEADIEPGLGAIEVLSIEALSVERLLP